MGEKNLPHAKQFPFYCKISQKQFGEFFRPEWDYIFQPTRGVVWEEQEYPLSRREGMPPVLVTIVSKTNDNANKLREAVINYGIVWAGGILLQRGLLSGVY